MGPSRSSFSRREFLGSLSFAAAAAAACRNERFRASDFLLPSRSPVALMAVSDYDADIAGVIAQGLALLEPAVKGRRILLKPNMVEYEAGTIINTHPAVIAGAIEAFRRAGASEVLVGEGPGHRRDTEYLLAASGLGDHLRDLKTSYVDLNLDDIRPVTLRSHFTGLDQVMLPVEVLRADLVVSMAKLKTHHWAGMTGAMKNLFGMFPGAVYGWPKNILHHCGIDNSILDLNATIRPGFTIVDAVVAMEGDGPIMGTPRACGFLAMGADLVAVDSTCARVMGFEPGKIPYLREGSRYLGNMAPDRIVQRGEDPARFTKTFEVIDRLKRFQRRG